LNGVITGELTRDYLNGRSNDPLQRRLLLLPWQPDDMTHLSYEQHEDDALFTSVCTRHCTSHAAAGLVATCTLLSPTFLVPTLFLHFHAFTI